MNITGRLTRDAQINTLPSDKQVVNFSLAVKDGYRNKEGEWVECTEYFNCAYWISTNVAKMLTKGKLVELTGRVSPNAWIGADGEVHAVLNFHTSNIKFHGGANNLKLQQVVVMSIPQHLWAIAMTKTICPSNTPFYLSI